MISITKLQILDQLLQEILEVKTITPIAIPIQELEDGIEDSGWVDNAVVEIAFEIDDHAPGPFCFVSVVLRLVGVVFVGFRAAEKVITMPPFHWLILAHPDRLTESKAAQNVQTWKYVLLEKVYPSVVVVPHDSLESFVSPFKRFVNLLSSQGSLPHVSMHEAK